jgi:hypothetical protein
MRRLALYMTSHRHPQRVRDAIQAYRTHQVAGQCIECGSPAVGDPAVLTHVAGCRALTYLEWTLAYRRMNVSDLGVEIVEVT